MTRCIPSLLPMAIALALTGFSSATAAAPAARDPVQLDAIVVVASRSPEPLAQVVSSVSVVDRDEIEQRLAQDVGDLVRYVPGLRMDIEPNRFGARGFAIRGLGGNRVRVEIDGVPLPDAFAVGAFASAGRDLADLEAIERIEVLRGPASTLYGSDALAGVVAIHSRDPDDLLARTQEDRVFGARVGYGSRDHSRLLAGHWAAKSADGWQAMALLSQREGSATDNRAWREQDAPNPADTRRRAFLGKLGRDFGDFGHWELIVDSSRSEVATDVVSQRFAPGRFTTTYQLLADDATRRDRVSLGAHWTSPWSGVERIELLAYAQDSAIRQDTDQYRLADRSTRFASLRERRFEFWQDERGMDLLAHSRWQSGAFSHRWVYGLELEHTRYEGLRDGVETNLASGARNGVILGERFPVRDFPTSVADRRALFVQDEISWGAWALIPALRYEHYRLDARPDAVFVEDYPDIRTVDAAEDSLTAKLGLRWNLSPRQHLFVQAAEGFRAPPFSDLNIGLILTSFNYEVRPNPDLKPENSRGLDIGWRWQGDALHASVSAYENRYRNLIDTRANLGTDPGSGALVFQSVNRDRARIYGLEAEFEWNLAAVGATAEGFSLRGAMAVAQGKDSRRDLPLNGIDPASAVLGLRFDSANLRWGAETLMTAVKRKTRIDSSSGPLFQPPGYATLDAFVWYAPGPRVKLNLGMFNMADRRYWTWSSVRGVSPGASNLGFYTQPGRSYSASLALAF